jgi:hypothetical protein
MDTDHEDTYEARSKRLESRVENLLPMQIKLTNSTKELVVSLKEDKPMSCVQEKD